MNTRFMNLSVPEEEKKEILDAIDRVLTHGIMILGPEVFEFEKKFSEYVGKKYCLGVGSGTDALILALKALGLKKGDEVITTSLSWIATANAIVLSGATPVFADINEDLNIDPESIERLITSKTKAILPVHYTGRVCDMESIKKIANRHNLYIVEDCSQSAGAKLNGRMSGSFGDISCFSMNPMKILGACGEAGAILTDSEDIFKKLEILRYNGTVNRETCIETSHNARLDTIQAAILSLRIDKIYAIVEKRISLAQAYNVELRDYVSVPIERENELHSYYSYTILGEFRDDLKNFLFDRGIETKIQHPILMPDQPAYKNWTVSETAKASQLVQKILCLPANEKITQEEHKVIVERIKNFYLSKLTKTDILK